MEKSSNSSSSCVRVQTKYKNTWILGTAFCIVSTFLLGSTFVWNLTKLNFESWSEACNPAERPPKFNLGGETCKVSEPLNSC